MTKEDRIIKIEKELAILKQEVAEETVLTIKEECRPCYEDGFILNSWGNVKRRGFIKEDNEVNSYSTEKEALQAKNLQLLRQLWRNNKGDNKGLYHAGLGAWSGFKKGYAIQDVYLLPNSFNFQTETQRDLFWNKAEKLGLLNNDLYKI
jgi:hypothetical protein